jgi:NAD(P)-dependent dehydrogenase (short-subunit alcohol dehydrogenase family)
MTMRRVLITGAGQGLGLEWARQALADGARVVATARRPEESEGLNALAQGAPAGRLTVLPMDVTDDASVAAAAGAVAAEVGALDELVNNAGTYGPRGDHALAASPDDVRRILEVNAIGPYRVTRAFLALLKKGSGPRVVFITSRMGSIGDAPGGASYAYRMSKSALNMLGANLASDLRGEGIVAMLLHPGWVKTRMGGDRAPVTIPESVTGMRRLAARATPAESGRFFDYSGAPVPW